MFNPDSVADFPEKPGVYIMKDKRNRIIYVGKAVSLKNRVRSYFQSKKPSVKSCFDGFKGRGCGIYSYRFGS